MKTTHAIIQALTDKITSELRPVDREAAFDESLDSEGEVNVAGLTFLPSQIWKEMDPTAYRCGVNDYADGEAWVEIDGETYDQREVESIVSDFREELESELSDLEAELEAYGEDEPDEMKVAEAQQRIADKQAEIDAIASDDFSN